MSQAVSMARLLEAFRSESRLIWTPLRVPSSHTFTYPGAILLLDVSGNQATTSRTELTLCQQLIGDVKYENDNVSARLVGEYFHMLLVPTRIINFQEASCSCFSSSIWIFAPSLSSNCIIL